MLEFMIDWFSMESFLGYLQPLKPTLVLNKYRYHMAIATEWGSAALFPTKDILKPFF